MSGNDSNTSHSNNNNNNYITDPNCNDVLFGRGAATRDFVGTKRFHEICHGYKDEFCSTKKLEPKNILAYRIINTIHQLNPPGRFLRSIPIHEARQQGYNDCSSSSSSGERKVVWEELDCNVALAKTKQCIRDMKSKDSKKEAAAAASAMIDNKNLSSVQIVVPQQQKRLLSATSVENNNKTGDLQSKVTGASILPPPQDSSDEKFHQGTNRDDDRHNHDDTISTKAQRKRALEISSSSSSHCGGGGGVVLEHNKRSTAERQLEIPQVVATLKHSRDEHEVANQLLALMTLDEAPRYTALDERKELSQMTEQEQCAAVQDVFGVATTMPSFDDLDQEQQQTTTSQPAHNKNKSVSLSTSNNYSDPNLLSAMIHELELIPVWQKMAFLEGLAKADPSEFCNDRLSAFLQREDGNPKNAAERLVAYWEERRKVFGPEKFTNPLTISGALRDDLTALLSGVFQLLPHLDASGRHIILKTMEFDTRIGYGTEHLIRVFFYLTEVISTIHGGSKEFVIVIYGSTNGKLSGFDHALESKMFDLEKRCVPAQLSAFHPICPPLIHFVIKPIGFALMDRRIRNRTIMHDLSNFNESLATCGIFLHMLPTYMGGTVELDPCQFIEQQRHVEEEEQTSENQK